MTEEYNKALNERMTQLLREYANEFEFKTVVDKEQEIVLFNIFANERGTEKTPQTSMDRRDELVYPWT